MSWGSQRAAYHLMSAALVMYSCLLYVRNPDRLIVHRSLPRTFLGHGSRLVVLMSNFESFNPVKLDSVLAGSRLLFSRIEDRQRLQEFPIR
jgi:hypothetical protein